MFSSLDLIRANEWSRSFFTTYALSLSFFEAVVLDALVRQNVRQTLILADVKGVGAALSEMGVRSVGRAYEVEPVAVNHGCFHPKLLALTSSTEAHLVVGSGNLTFGGWGSNLECVEHIHPGVSADAFDDAADFLDSLATAPPSAIRHAAMNQCTALAEDLRRLSASGLRTGRVRIIHGLDRPIFEQMAEIAEDLGGAQRLTIASPFYDGGSAVNQLCTRLGLGHAHIHSHPAGTVAGSFGSNWPKEIDATIKPVEIELFAAEEPRPLHAKAFEILCRHGRVVLSGSANATMAALDRNRNVELCVVRIENGMSTGWRLAPSVPATGMVPLADDTNGNRGDGVLRAVLIGVQLRGWVLTHFPPGNATLALLTGSKPIPIGETVVSADGHFELQAPSFEQESWKTQRLILRLESPSGKVAQGFVSFPDFAYVAERAGHMLPQFLALVGGNETPDDVAAIMSWFLENPTGLPKEDFASGGGQHTAPEPTDTTVPVSDLLLSTVVDTGGLPSTAFSKALSWRRFMETVLACFREPRGPIADDPDPTADDGEETIPTDHPKEDPPDQRRQTKWPTQFLEKMLDRLLAGPAFDRGRAFWFTHFVCDRIAPDATRIAECLGRVLDSFVGCPPEERDREAVAVATLIWAHLTLEGNRYDAIITRRKLLRLGVDMTRSAPDANLVRGFTRVLAPDFDMAAEWNRIGSVKTAQEEVRAFRLAGRTAPLRDGFTYLKSTSEFQTLTERDRARIIFISRLTPYCPNCNLALVTADLSRLRESGVVRARCCDRILLSEEI